MCLARSPSGVRVLGNVRAREPWVGRANGLRWIVFYLLSGEEPTAGSSEPCFSWEPVRFCWLLFFLSGNELSSPGNWSVHLDGRNRRLTLWASPREDTHEGISHSFYRAPKKQFWAVKNTPRYAKTFTFSLRQSALTLSLHGHQRSESGRLAQSQVSPSSKQRLAKSAQ